MKATTLCGLVLAVFISAAQASDPFADTVVSYTEGVGDPAITGYNRSSSALGGLTSYATVVNPAWKRADIVSIGQGGELTLGFDEPIENDPDNPFGLDFTIFGNTMFILNDANIYTSLYAHEGLTVWVSANNADYYRLNITLGADEGFPTEATGDPTRPLDPALTPAGLLGLTSKTGGPDLYNGSAGGASYDIAWAVNSEGQAVTLSSISYVKIVGTNGYGYIDAVADIATVPEPGVCALLLAGAGIAWAFRRRLQAAA